MFCTESAAETYEETIREAMAQRYLLSVPASVDNMANFYNAVGKRCRKPDRVRQGFSLNFVVKLI